MAEKRSRRISTFGSRLTSLVSVTLVLFMVGLAAMLGLIGKGLTDEVRRNIGFVIVMERETPENTINILKRVLLADKAVEQFTYVSADEILAGEKEALSEDVLALLDSNPYAAEFDVKVKSYYAETDSIYRLVENYSALEGVSDVVTESAVIEGVDTLLRRAGMVVLVVAGLLLLVSIALINNTVSLSVYGRRFVIHTMKLVGATGAFIRKPFLLAGALQGLIAGLFASALLAGGRAYVGGMDATIDSSLNWGVMSGLFAALVLAGMAVTTLTAMFATNRYLRASYDEMFLK